MSYTCTRTTKTTPADAATSQIAHPSDPFWVSRDHTYVHTYTRLCAPYQVASLHTAKAANRIRHTAATCVGSWATSYYLLAFQVGRIMGVREDQKGLYTRVAVAAGRTRRQGPVGSQVTAASTYLLHAYGPRALHALNAKAIKGVYVDGSRGFVVTQWVARVVFRDLQRNITFGLNKK
ncbi:hypothetical protein F5X96DRAFT_2784 [Biscogniauxia mediterranea]|nr:hypothetical protein F5X96DRAFT_2784 [Biscogniauxia mediterranea]